MSKPVPVRYAGPVVGHGAGPADAGAAVFASRGAAGEGAEGSRSDGRLAHAGSGSHGVLNAWPSEPRPSLASARRLTFSRSTNQWVYVPAPGTPPRAVRRPGPIFAPPPRPPAYRPPARPPIYVPYQPSHPGYGPGRVY
ncbi:MAG: hypothetical protein EA378_03760 [Phycisphaerales bacterium]|nr:MAG: hypothetical protein EA378_03760 [Phycisphaerales bacterium]